MIDNLNDDNFLIYAIKAYDSRTYLTHEFEEDMKRFMYLNRLFTRYVKFGDLRERLIINHLIILNNVFGPEHVNRLLFFKISKDYYSILKTFLLFLNIMRDRVHGVDGVDIISSDIPVDMKVVKVLREIK